MVKIFSNQCFNNNFNNSSKYNKPKNSSNFLIKQLNNQLFSNKIINSKTNKYNRINLNSKRVKDNFNKIILYNNQLKRKINRLYKMYRNNKL